jgi:hypothetical protein
LVSGFGIVALPVPYEGPARPHVHDAQAEKAQDSGDRCDELRDVFGVGENLLNSVFQSQGVYPQLETDGLSGQDRCGINSAYIICG